MPPSPCISMGRVAGCRLTLVRVGHNIAGMQFAIGCCLVILQSIVPERQGQETEMVAHSRAFCV